MSKQFHFKQFSLARVRSLVLFDPWIRPSQVLPLRVRRDLGTITMKGYSAFPKAPALLESHHLMVFLSYLGHSLGRLYPIPRETVSVFNSPRPLGNFTGRVSNNRHCTCIILMGCISFETPCIFIQVILYIYIYREREREREKEKERG